MTEAVEQAAPIHIPIGDVAALLNWWSLSGVDSLAAEAPTPWLGADTAPDPMAHAPNQSQQIQGDNRNSRARGVVHIAQAAQGPLQQAHTAQPTGQPAQNLASVPDRPARAPQYQVRQVQGEPDWSQFADLASLRTHVATQFPRAPFADGNPDSGLLILGEAPSASDLQTGKPFSGPAGLFLDKLLRSIGRDRSSCYVSLLCPRKATAGPPAPDAIEADLALTQAHIRLLNPQHVLLLGAIPLHALTPVKTPIGKARGEWTHLQVGDLQIPALPTYNPAYLLRRPEDKAKAWADLRALARRLTA